MYLWRETGKNETPCYALYAESLRTCVKILHIIPFNIYSFCFFLLFFSTHQFNRIDNAGFLCALHIWTACICWCANSQRREKINRKKNLKYIIFALVKVAQPINYPVNRLNRHSAARSMHANKLKHSLNIEKFIIL